MPRPAAAALVVRALGVRALSLLAAMALGLLWVAVSPPAAYACTCQGVSNQSSARQADAIFLGTVVKKSPVRKPAPGRTDIRFQVSRVYKGSVYSQQVVASPLGVHGCGIDPEINSTWIMFAKEGVEGSGDQAVFRLITRLCSGNLPGAAAPVYLGAGHQPQPGASDRDERATATDATFSRVLRVSGLGLLALAVLAGAGLAVLWRPGRRAR